MAEKPPERPRFLPKFGQFLENLRKQRKPGWGTKQVAKVARDDGYRRITPNRLFLVEAGAVSDVDAVFLGELARFYRVPYQDLVWPLVEEKYQIGDAASQRQTPMIDEVLTKESNMPEISSSGRRIQQSHSPPQSEVAAPPQQPTGVDMGPGDQALAFVQSVWGILTPELRQDLVEHARDLAHKATAPTGTLRKKVPR